MSDDLADIYITRDKFRQGELHGRLVCAVFVNPSGFVEITVHPDDGGRVSAPTAPAPVPPPDRAITEAQAVRIARANVADSGGWEVQHVESGPVERILGPWDVDHAWAEAVPPERWVWRVFLVSRDRGVDVVMDHATGTVLGTVEGIVN